MALNAESVLPNVFRAEKSAYVERHNKHTKRKNKNQKQWRDFLETDIFDSIWIFKQFE